MRASITKPTVKRIHKEEDLALVSLVQFYLISLD